MTRNRFALAACFSALVFSCCTTARAQSTLTWDDLAKGVSATQDRSDALYRAWDPVAFQSFEAAWQCRENTAKANCSKDPCKSIKQRLEWLGLLCVAEQARHDGEEKARTRALEKSLLSLKQEMPAPAWADRKRLLEAEATLANKRLQSTHAQVLSAALGGEVTNYFLWRTGQAVLASHLQKLKDLEVEASTGNAEAQFELGKLIDDDRTLPDRLVRASQWYAKAAEQGHADAQNNLALMYLAGEGVPKDSAQAVVWFRKAAEKGHALAQLNLGLRYTLGDGIAKDDASAVAWFRKSAEQGNADAQRELGVMLAKGNGVPKDEAQAIAWYLKAAERGNATAQFFLGMRYESGQGVNKDPVRAFDWHLKAAEQGHVGAQNEVGVAFLYGMGVAKDSSKAVFWFRKSAEQGNAAAQHNLGTRYLFGEGVAKDDTQAAAWLRKAAEQGFADAQYNLGVAYAHGTGVSQDAAIAASWYRKAADQGLAQAQFTLAVGYTKGDGVPTDAAQAVFWFRKAAEQGYADAQNSLGWDYAHGNGGLLQDNLEAAKWYKRAATQGEKHAQRNLSQLYVRGAGVPQSLVAAYAWMNLAAAAGHERAPAERDEIASQLSPAELQTAQALSREWKQGQLIPEVRSKAQVPAATSNVQRPQPTTAAPVSLFPSQPAKRPGVVSCNTRCTNSDCYRTYDDGKQVRFQAQRKMNAFGEWEWDSGSC